jgi:hypothetical protein
MKKIGGVSEGSRTLNEEFLFPPEKLIFPRKISVFVLSTISIIRQV